jgi:hypothetical protein
VGIDNWLLAIGIPRPKGPVTRMSIGVTTFSYSHNNKQQSDKKFHCSHRIQSVTVLCYSLKLLWLSKLIKIKKDILFKVDDFTRLGSLSNCYHESPSLVDFCHSSSYGRWEPRPTFLLAPTFICKISTS